MTGIAKSSLFSLEVSEALKNPTQQQACEVIEALWPGLKLDDVYLHLEHYAPFWTYISKELVALQPYQNDFAVSTVETLSSLIATLVKNKDKSRDDLATELKAQFLNYADTTIANSLDLALRLWLTVNVRSPSSNIRPTHSQEPRQHWQSTLSVETFVSQLFVAQKEWDKTNEHRVDPRFTLSRLEVIADINIHWTDYLTEHLKYNSMSRTLNIYQHKSCLLHHLDPKSASVIPKAVLEEAVDTLNLLLPFGQQATKDLLAREKKGFYTLGLCGRPVVHDLRKYKYWREELMELTELFKQPVHHWWQLFYDNRDKMQFVTFWIAVVVFVLTVISLALGIWSGVYTYKQYELGRLQLCFDDGAAAALKQLYC